MVICERRKGRRKNAPEKRGTKMTTKILGGYEITIQDDNQIIKLEKEHKKTKFAFKFYERNKNILDKYTNIADFVKSEQNRADQSRVSVDIITGRTNTDDTHNLIVASYSLLDRVQKTAQLVNDSDRKTLLIIIDKAKKIILEKDEDTKKMTESIEKLQRIRKDLSEIFGENSENVNQVNSKIRYAEGVLAEHIKDLTSKVS